MRARSTLAICLFLSLASCKDKKLEQQHADIRTICDHYTRWEKDEEFLKAPPEDKLEALVDLFEEEVKSEHVRDAFANLTSFAEFEEQGAVANKLFYSLAPKDFRCPAFDRTYPREAPKIED